MGIAVYKVGSYVVVVMLGNMRMRRESTLVCRYDFSDAGQSPSSLISNSRILRDSLNVALTIAIRLSSNYYAWSF